MSRKATSGLVPVREPTGRLSRASQAAIDAISPAEAKRLRTAALVGLRDPEWATEYGRLYLEHKIDEVQFEAAKRWNRLVVAYHRAIGATPPYPKTVAFDRRDPSPPPDPDSDEGKKMDRASRAIIADMGEAHAVLIGSGKLAERAVRSVCEENECPVGQVGLDNLKRGLEWLADFWQLTKPAKRNRHGR